MAGLNSFSNQISQAQSSSKHKYYCFIILHLSRPPHEVGTEVKKEKSFLFVRMVKCHTMCARGPTIMVVSRNLQEIRLFLLIQLAN